MPELPELEVVREVLQRRVVGQRIDRLELIQPGAAIVVRDLTGLGVENALAGASIVAVARRGKFLLFTCATDDGPCTITINPKLSGRLQLASPDDKRMAKTHLVLLLSGGQQLRYVDQKQMGQIYLSRAAPADAGIPDFADLGPEPLDVTLDHFRERLCKFQGEIKGILVRGEFVAGIGNAYADEILWEARLHPYRKRKSLSDAEIVQLYDAMRRTLIEATEQVSAKMGEQIHLKPRDFLKIHMQRDQPCPRCGNMISEVSANQRITNFCRSCQPGGLLRGM